MLFVCAIKSSSIGFNTALERNSSGSIDLSKHKDSRQLLTVVTLQVSFPEYTENIT